MRRLLILSTASLAALLLAWLPSPDAHACGGFFCANAPMDQVGERIVFGVEPGKVTAVIQIAYEGEAEDFAWVVPVQAAPEISLAPDALFQGLDWRTQPRHFLSWDYQDGQCSFPVPEMAADGGTGGRSPEDDGVTVVDEQQVGPLLTVTLDSDDPGKLLDWLNENGFDQPPESLTLIEHYLGQDMLFVAMKLEQGASAGELQPVVFEMDTDEACVPLVLTRIAAQPDMPVLVWVLGDHRAVPTSWFDVEINQKKIDWLNRGQNYREIATQAIDEASGHGFVTEYAQPTDQANLDGMLYAEGRFDVEALAAIEDPVAFLDAMLGQGFPRDSQIQALIGKHIPKPPAEDLPKGCKEDREFYNFNLASCIEHMDEDWVFDPQDFADDLETRVVVPLEDAQALLDSHAYLTRLFSTVSPEEMTRDPMFDFNPDLGDVSNIHEATAVAECTRSGTVERVTITLEDGESFVVEGPFSFPPEPIVDGAPEEAAASTIRLLSTSGPGQEVAPEDVEDKARTLASIDPTYLPFGGATTDPPGGADPPVNGEPPTGQDGDGTTSTSGSGEVSGCQGGPGAPLWAGVLALMGLAVLRRRRLPAPAVIRRR